MSAQAPKTNEIGEKKEWSPLELAEMKTGRRIGAIHRPAGFTGRKRVKLKKTAACYHVMSRTVNGEFLLGDIEKEAFRRMMWRMAKFSGVEILTYALMDNHFHILLKVPEQGKWLKKFDGVEGEAKLLEHLKTVYSKAFLAQLGREIGRLREQKREDEVEVLLGRFKKRFCDVSLFVKELKERFSRWYNRQNGRRGTLWMDRFQSVLVESGEALRTMAAYIDLNPVRAGLVDDPVMSEWTGYGEAMKGSRRAKRGLCKILGVSQDSWDTKGAPLYRCWLYGEGVSVAENDPATGGERSEKRRGFTVTQMVRVKKEQQGKLEVAEMLRKRMSSFSYGVALGGENFIKGVATQYQEEFQRKFRKRGKKVPGVEGGRFKPSIYTLRK